jgi:hypothetical protein
LEQKGEEEGRLTYLWLLILVFLFMLYGAVCLERWAPERVNVRAAVLGDLGDFPGFPGCRLLVYGTRAALHPVRSERLPMISDACRS